MISLTSDDKKLKESLFKAVGLGLVVKEVLLGPTSPVLSSASSVFRTCLAGDSRGPCGRPGARGHRVGYLCSRVINDSLRGLLLYSILWLEV